MRGHFFFLCLPVRLLQRLNLVVDDHGLEGELGFPGPFHAQQPGQPLHQGNTEVENNGYVVFKLNILGSAPNIEKERERENTELVLHSACIEAVFLNF